MTSVPGPESIDDLLARVHVVALPMRVRFRGLTEREVALVEGPAGWGEFGAFPEYDDPEAAHWLRSALEMAWQGPPPSQPPPPHAPSTPHTTTSHHQPPGPASGGGWGRDGSRLCERRDRVHGCPRHRDPQPQPAACVAQELGPLTLPMTPASRLMSRAPSAGVTLSRSR